MKFKILAFLIVAILITSLTSYKPAYGMNSQNNLSDYQIGMFYDPAHSSNITHDLYMMKNAGITWIRFNFAWNLIEPIQGNYNFSIYDNFVNEALSLGFKLIGILGHGSVNLLPSWLLSIGGVNNPNYLLYLSNYSKSVVQRYGNKISIWQIENELNDLSFYLLVGFRTGNWNFDIAKKILLNLSQIVRTYSTSPIMVNVLVNNLNWLSFIQNLTNWHVSYDIIGIDYYPTYLDDYSANAGSPDKGLKIFDYINSAKQFGKEIIVAETGYSNYNSIHMQDKQAEYVRKVIEGAVLAGVKLIAFYDYSDPPGCVAQGNTISSVEGHFGFIDCNGTPKQSWYELRNATFNKHGIRIEDFAQGAPLNLSVYIDGLKLVAPINVTLPPGNIVLKVPKQTKVNETLYVFQKALVNNQQIFNSSFSVNLIQDYYIKIFFYTYYPLKISIFVKGIGYVNSTLEVLANNTKFNVSNGVLYLKEGYYVINFPSNLTIYGIQAQALNNSVKLMLNSPTIVNVTYVPVYNLTVIIVDWLGNLATSEIKLNSTNYTASTLNLELMEGNYSLSVSSPFSSIETKIDLNGNQYLILYVPNTLILVLMFLLIAFLVLLPSIFLAIKKKYPRKDMKAYKAILSSVGYVISLIIIPYFITTYLSQSLNNQSLVIWNLNELLIFGLPVAITSALSLIKRPNIPWNIINAFFLILYLYFVVGRAYAGQFGVYEIAISNIYFSINIALYVFILIILVVIRSIADFFLTYIK